MLDQMHPNMALMTKLDLRNLDACSDLFSDKFTWHYFNSHLSELEGSYRGIDGLKGFFSKLGETSKGSFNVQYVDARPVGDELVVTQVCNKIALGGATSEFDAVVIWRIVNGKITEAWDIPAVNTMRSIEDIVIGDTALIQPMEVQNEKI